MSTERLIAEYIESELAVGRARSISPEIDLFSEGILDSLGVLRLVMFLEERFGVEIPDEDVVFENFQSVNAIAMYIKRNGAIDPEA